MEQNKNRKRLFSIISWGIAGILIAITGAVIVFGGFRKGQKPVIREKRLANVEVMTVRAEEYREALTLPALVEADSVAAIRSEFPGILERWLIKEGSMVERGQLVAELNMDNLTANLEEMKASMTSASESSNLAAIAVANAELELENARKRVRIQEIGLRSAEADLELVTTEFERVQKLVARNTLYRSQLDTARNKLKQAELSAAKAKEGLDSARLDVRSSELRVKQSKANQELAKAKLMELDAAVANILVKIKKSNLRAPISGRLDRHMVEHGEVISAGAPIAYIYDLRYLRATVNVPDRYIAFIDPNNPAGRSFIRMNRPGSEQQVHAKIIIPGLPELTDDNEPGLEFEAEIAHIAQSSDPESNTFKVELRFANPGEALKQGVIARGKIEYLYYPEAIIIPAKSIQVTDAGPRVMVMENSRGRQRVKVMDIEPLALYESKVLIGKGPAEGDKLVVSGWKGLVGGEEVNVLVEDGRFISPKPIPARTASEE